jgi:23S rRNA (uracil1939-C5)-methyltransferase
MMINLVTADDSGNEKHVRGLAERLTQEFDFISTIIHSVNRKKAEVATGDEEYVLFGPGYIEEQIGQWVFRISANSFFQANTRGTEMLYERIIEFGALNKEDIVFDLYSGVGTIAIYISTHVKQVVGFEVVGAAVEDAWQNCRLNGVDNCRFVSGDLRSSLNSAIGSGQAAAHVVVVDPPRAGMHEQVVRELLNLRPERFVYVSCNPTTFARDAAILCHRDYELQIVQPVDMFPMTAHVELVGSFRVR